MEKLSDDRRFYDISENFKEISEKIAASALKSGRTAEDIRFMAVTKTVEPKYINHALSLGLDLIGENRVQEFMGKKDELNLEGVEKHLIGHLQTNKVKQIVGNVDSIDGVDSIKVAKEIGKISSRLGITTNILLEINIGAEESKFGFTPESIGETVYEVAEIEGIKVKGLMAVPPICDNSAKNRIFFENMHQLFIDIGAKNIDNISMDILSMGMSGDYDEAIIMGANMVRIGSALFGARNYR
ncbi:MAG: YggS family pyridoxal phosphate-dependent enzyme [Clostridia bacterium]|nr:YggS family pyridoxal phosphate-dependent enzyme [Clostridia bacterium]